MSYNDGYSAGFLAGRVSMQRDIDWVPEVERKKKTKRKPTAYQKRYATAYRKLKRQHPRMTFGSISKKAHKVARQ